LHDPWDVEVHLEEVIDAGDRMLVTGHATGRGRGSGIKVEAPFFVVNSFRAGRIISEQYFNGRDEALSAANPRSGRP
jgi:ketosteroid isomerase-like protein